VGHLGAEELLTGLARVKDSPSVNGTLELIVRRPSSGSREVLDVGELDPAAGLVGDRWSKRAGTGATDEVRDVDTQLTLMNSRFIALVAQDKSRWPLAGDQLFVDFDLSRANVPAGTRLRLGSAVLEITAEPHTGCSKFVQRFGLDATKLVNSPLGRELQLRGVNAKVVEAGVIRTGDVVAKLQ
jgi:hypothetical protein